MYRNFSSITLFVLLGLVGLNGSAWAQRSAPDLAKPLKNAERAMKAMFEGPPVKKLRVVNHEFNIYLAKSTVRGKIVTLEGRISHHLSFRPDDQIRYKIVKVNGVITSVRYKVNRGGFSKLVKKYQRILDPMMKAKIPILKSADMVEALKKLGRFYDGKWETALSRLLATAAIRLDATGGDGLSKSSGQVRHRRGSSSISDRRKARRRDLRGRKRGQN
jgi:hypothetical protein